MKATVLKDGIRTEYFFEPEHYYVAFEAYTQMVRTGEIDTFSLTLLRY
jgi:hypothetical protein